MNYHNILHDDMRNGVGLRVTLFLSGCEHHCKNCQNQQTWSSDSGIFFDLDAKKEILEALNNDYINGITFSGGDPLHPNNVLDVFSLCKEIKSLYPDKTIWLYTGYKFEDLWIPNGTITTSEWNLIRDVRNGILYFIDVLVDGRFIEELADVNYHWAGSKNQRVIDVKETLKFQRVILLKI